MEEVKKSDNADDKGTVKEDNQGQTDNQETSEKKTSDTVPYYKLKKEVDKRRELEEKLTALEQAELKRQEDAARKKGDFEKLLESEKQRSQTLAQELDSIKGYVKQTSIKQQVLSEIIKHNPQDASDVLRFIEIEKLDIEDSENEVKVLNVDKVVENLKQNKPYLFANKDVNNFNPLENSKVNLEKKELPINTANSGQNILNALKNLRK